MTDGLEMKEIDPKENEEKEEGATMIEYALLIVLIAIIAIAALRFLGQRISKQFSGIAASVGGA